MTVNDGLTTAGYSSAYERPWRLAGSLIVLANELSTSPGYSDLTCLGTLGNTAHVDEGYGSDHNPFIVHNGVGIVRAIDIAGSDEQLRKLRAHLWDLYAARDPRMFEYGYSKGCSDNLINNWGLPFGVHVDSGDAGHLHVSVTQINGNNPSPGGYVAAIDSTASWGLSTPSQSGTSTQEDDDMELIKNKDSGAVVAHLGGGVMKSVSPSVWSIWNNLGRESTQLSAGPWNAYTAFLSQGGQAATSAIAAAVAAAAAPDAPDAPDVDPTALAAEIATQLNASLPAAVVAALASALSNKTGATA